MAYPNSNIEGYRPDIALAMKKFNTAVDRAGFVGLKLAPVQDVPNQSEAYSVIPTSSLLQTVSTDRANNGTYNRVNMTFEKDTYYCKEDGIEIPLDDRTSKMYMNWFDFETAAAELSRDIILRNKEIEIVNAALDVSKVANVASTNGGYAAWDNHASAKPVEFISEIKKSIRDRTGIVPNTMVVPWEIYNNHLRFCAEVLDRITASGAGSGIASITPQMLAEVFDVENFIVADSVKNTKRLNESASFADIWDRTKTLLCYSTAVNANGNEPSYMRTLHWSADGSSIGGTVETYYSNETRGMVVRCRMDTAIKYRDVNLGEVITGCIS